MSAVRPTALILGGGVAGLASAIALGRQGWQCTILERDLERRCVGQGLLMPANGLEALEQLGVRGLDALTVPIDAYELCDRDGRCLRRFAIPGSTGLLHPDLLDLLQRALPAGTELVEGHGIGLTRGAADTWALIDAAGRRWCGDLIVASDGVGSLCRRLLFPRARLTPERTTEIVMVIRAPDLVRSLGRCCRKFQDVEAGLALGLLPCRDDQLVVFAQFATARHPLEAEADWGVLLRRCFSGWNPCLDALLAGLESPRARLWRTTDLDPLPQLHQGNLVLVGDSGHPLLTFTSQGAASALQDALLLAAQLQALPPGRLQVALERYSRLRRPELLQLVEEGRRKQQLFLDPTAWRGAASAPLVGFGQPPLLTR